MKTFLPPFKLISHLLTLDLTVSELKVAVALALCRNAHSGRCCPAQITITTATSLSRPTIVRVVAKLRAKAVLTTYRHRRNSTNHHFFLFDLQELATNSRSNGNAYKELETVITNIQNKTEVSSYCDFADVSLW